MNQEHSLTGNKEMQHWDLFNVVFDVPVLNLPKFVDPDDEQRHRDARRGYTAGDYLPVWEVK